MKIIHVGVREGFSQGHMTGGYIILVQNTGKTILSHLEVVTWTKLVPRDLESYPAEVFPVQEIAQTLSPVPLDDPLAPALLAELKQEGSELVTGLVDPSKPPVHDVNTCKKDTACCERKQDILTYLFKEKLLRIADNLTDKVCETHHMLRGLLCAPPWNSQNLTGWLRLMGFPWLCTQLTARETVRPD